MSVEVIVGVIKLPRPFVAYIALEIEVNGNGLVISRLWICRRSLGGDVGKIPIFENACAAFKSVELALGIGLTLENSIAVVSIVYCKIVRDSVINALTARIANTARAAEREEIICASGSACAFNIDLFEGIGGVF